MRRSSRSRRFAVTLCGLGVLVTALSGCTISTTNGHVATPTIDLTGPDGIKLPVRGLVLMSDQQAYKNNLPFDPVDTGLAAEAPGVFSGIAVNVSWSQLEPRRGDYDWSPLDASLAKVTAYNATHPEQQLTVKLRVLPGYAAATWAKDLGGQAVRIDDRPHLALSGSLGRWWTADYRAAWSTFEHALAARYDTNPLIHSAQVTSCSTNTDEPLLLPGTPEDSTRLVAAGFTLQAHKSCLAGAFADFSGWRKTPIEFPLNPLRGGFDTADITQTEFSSSVADQCAALERRSNAGCIISYHGLSPTAPHERPAAWFFRDVRRLWTSLRGRLRVTFQFVNPNVENVCGSLRVAHDYHADSVELWAPSMRANGPRGFKTQRAVDLVIWNKALQARQQVSC